MIYNVIALLVYFIVLRLSQYVNVKYIDSNDKQNSISDVIVFDYDGYYGVTL